MRKVHDIKKAYISHVLMDAVLLETELEKILSI
jgi:hypothetical protein